MKSVFVRGIAASFLAILAFAGGGRAPASGSAHLAGEWDYTYTASEPEGCAVQPELVPGLSAGGTLDLAHWGPVLSGTWEERGGDQTCGIAGDWMDDGTLEPTITGRTLTFEIRGNRFRAEIPPGNPDVIEGNVTCAWGDDGGTLEGTWRMTRL